MAMFSKESLESLRERIDLIEVLSTHLDLKKSGASYKACCPFHEEKSPSFIVKRGDNHYHCFGCGAHGDAIAFLMNHLKLSFTDAAEQLADRFGIHLQSVEGVDAQEGPSKSALREANSLAAEFFSAYLLHTDEGHRALHYLYDRGLDLNFIRAFRIGFAPKDLTLFMSAMRKRGQSLEVLKESALTKLGKKDRYIPFFHDRIMFPILDAAGHVIGFSGRKVCDDAFGPKYLNTPETALFKKSKVLFGLHQSRRRIAKDKQAIICEGQIDALRLIQAGFNFTVAAQGTAFGQTHAQMLIDMGVNHIFLALDGDSAGKEAVIKIGHFFQKEGIDVSVVIFADGLDPDTFLREEGPVAFAKLLEESIEYLTYLIQHYSIGLDLSRPAVKTDLVQTISHRIRDWNHPLMVHESLRKLAKLIQVPESTIGLDTPAQNSSIRKTGTLTQTHVDPDRVLETDLLRWLLLIGQNQPELSELIIFNIQQSHFQTPVCRHLFVHICEQFKQGHAFDLLSLSISLENAEEQLFLSELLQKRVNQSKARHAVEQTIQQLLERHWLLKREEIKVKIHSGACSDEEVLQLAKEFDRLKSSKPTIRYPEGIS